MAGLVDMIFTSKFIYITTVAVVLINMIFFPNLLNNKDIKLMDLSYLINDKSYSQQNSTSINQNESFEGKTSYVFLSLSVMGLAAILYVLFKDFDLKKINKDDDEESLLSVASIINNKKGNLNQSSSIGYSLVDTEVGDE
jgi:hypothetical protein